MFVFGRFWIWGYWDQFLFFLVEHGQRRRHSVWVSCVIYGFNLCSLLSRFGTFGFCRSYTKRNSVKKGLSKDFHLGKRHERFSNACFKCYYMVFCVAFTELLLYLNFLTNNTNICLEATQSMIQMNWFKWFIKKNQLKKIRSWAVSITPPSIHIEPGAIKI